MAEFWMTFGKTRWPLLLATLVITALTLRSVWRLTGARASADVRTKAWIDAILFWGGFAMITGIFGTLVAMMLAAGYIERADEFQPRLVWAGFRIALRPAATGAFILGLASLAWFGLQLRWRKLATGPARHTGAGVSA